MHRKNTLSTPPLYSFPFSLFFLAVIAAIMLAAMSLSKYTVDRQAADISVSNNQMPVEYLVCPGLGGKSRL